VLSIAGPIRADQPAKGVTLSLSQASVWQRLPDQRTDLTVLTGSYDLNSSWTLFGRIGMVGDRSTIHPRAWGFANPSVGATVAWDLVAHLRLGLILGTTVPIGSGGGDGAAHSDPLRAMLNGTDWGGPMFGPNHLDVFEGFTLVARPGRFTLRLKSTLHPAIRVRAPKTDGLGPRVIFTSSGLMASYSMADKLSVFAEFAETRVLNRPVFLDPDPSYRSDHYGIAGVAADFRRGATTRLQPTLIYARAVDAPKSGRHFHLLELDLQVSF
jgi:hypothetical protein